LSSVIDKGGQGLLLRKPNSFYEEGSLYHIKKYDDAEVLYLGANEKSHRLVCQLPSGQQIMVSAPHQLFTKPLPINSVITIRYLNRNGVINSPCFLKLGSTSWEKLKEKTNENNELED